MSGQHSARAMAEEGLDEQEIEEGQDLYYVPEKALNGMKAELKGAKTPAGVQPHLDMLLDPEKVPDEENMLPVDMRGVEQDFDSIEDMIEKLGAVGAAEAFVKAREYFEANKDGEPADERPGPMTAAEWKQALNEEADDLLEGEEEEDSVFGEGDEEEIDEEEAEEAEEPPSKKAKTG